MKTGIELIAEERQRQIDEEGWTLEHDSFHSKGELAAAASCYAYPQYDEVKAHVSVLLGNKPIPENWPFDAEWWKPKDELRNLIRAGALIAAEIDRLQNENPTTI